MGTGFRRTFWIGGWELIKGDIWFGFNLMEEILDRNVTFNIIVVLQVFELV